MRQRLLSLRLLALRALLTVVFLLTIVAVAVTAPVELARPAVVLLTVVALWTVTLLAVVVLRPAVAVAVTAAVTASVAVAALAALGFVEAADAVVADRSDKIRLAFVIAGVIGTLGLHSLVVENLYLVHLCDSKREHICHRRCIEREPDYSAEDVCLDDDCMAVGVPDKP